MNELDEFISTWKRIIEDIKNSTVGIDRDGALIIWQDFGLTEGLLDIVGRNMSNQELLKIKLLEAELDTALSIALSKFKLQNRGILARIFGGVLSFLGPRKPEKE